MHETYNMRSNTQVGKWNQADICMQASGSTASPLVSFTPISVDVVIFTEQQSHYSTQKSPHLQ